MVKMNKKDSRSVAGQEKEALTLVWDGGARGEVLILLL